MSYNTELQNNNQELRGILEDVNNLPEAGSGEVALPDYWESYLPDKVAAIKAHQDEGGKDCFSFVVMTDIHYPSNLGKRSPAIAKRILDKCDIRYVLALGDFQNREPYNTKDEADAEWYDIRAMLEPINENVLMVKGNHDGSWGSTNSTYYAFNFTPAEIYNRLFALTYKYQNAVTDESGTAYYIDDTARKVRFIMLNTQCNPYEENEDGSAKYNNMTHARFTQVQFDFLTENALATIPSDDWNVILCGHHPLWEAELKDANIMLGVLNAYKNKSTYSGEYAGTAEGESTANYTNLLDENGDGFLWGYLGSDGVTEHPVTEKTRMITNKILVTFNKTTPNVVRFSGAQGYITHVKLYQSDGSPVSGFPNWITISSYPEDFVFDENGIMSWNAGQFDKYLSTTNCGTLAYVRFILNSGDTDMDLNTMAVTVNEEIVEVPSSGGGYDAVSVNANFSEAKGNLVGYFCGHNHTDMTQELNGVRQVITRCDSRQENTDALKNERVEGTTTEQSFDVFTVNKKTRKIYATKIGAGADREISY